MTAQWTEMPIGEVLRLEYGKPLNAADRKPDGLYPVYGANGEKDRTDRFYFEKPSIIVGRKGSAGEVNLAEDRFWPLDVTYFATFDERRHDLRFLYYLLTTLDLPRLAKGVKPGINRNEVYSQVAAIPPLAEQRRIVGILDEAFDGIAIATGNAEKNLRNARALFDSHLASVFTRRGEGWVEKHFSEVCEINSRLVDPRLPEHKDLLHVGGANIETKTGNLIGLRTASEDGLKSGKFLFNDSMVLYSKIRPYLMKVGRPDFSGLCSADIYPLSAKAGRLDRDFLFYLLLSPGFTDYAMAGSARAGMPKVNRNHLLGFRLHLPQLATQQVLAGQLDELHEDCQRLEAVYRRKIAALDDLKNVVLHRAFAGQLETQAA